MRSILARLLPARFLRPVRRARADDHDRPRRRRDLDRSGTSTCSGPTRTSRARLRALVAKDARQKLSRAWPIVARHRRYDVEVSWRRDVKFHDGSDFTADDVVFSLRGETIKNSPSSFTVYTKAITGTQVVDPHTVRLRTAAPYPLMPNDLSVVPIVSKKARAGRVRRTSNAGQGRGRHRAVQVRALGKGRPDRIGPQRHLLGARRRRGSARLSADHQRSGARGGAAVEPGAVIEAVPTADLAKLKDNAERRRALVPISYRLIYLHLDSNRDSRPFVTDKAGKPLTAIRSRTCAFARRSRKRSTGASSSSA